jgi:carboxymethylenebutenolidase
MQAFEVKGDSFSGYLSAPGAGLGSGILLLHAWWGLNEFVIETCDRLAAAGFVALAPDYYAGKVARSVDEARARRQELDRKSTNKLVALALDYLCSHPAVAGPALGVIGFSLGCSFALQAARSRSQVVRAVALFYGAGGGKFDRVQAAFMGHFADHDRWGAHAAKVNALADRIRSAGLRTEFFTYQDTEHWFAETDRPEYDQAAAELAWERSIRFLRGELG